MPLTTGRLATPARRLRVWLPVLVATTFVQGCRPDQGQTGAAESRKLVVLAAASVHDVVSELAARYEQNMSCRVALSVGATGALRRQVELGAPCDVFIAADPAHAEGLVEAGLAVARSIRVVAGNRLVVAARRASTAAREALDMPADLAGPTFQRIAIAGPDAAPAGVYARQALSHAGLWKKLAPKLVIADNAAAAANYLSLGVVDAAIVYANQTGPGTDLVSVYTFPATAHKPIQYAAVIVTPSRAADEFLDLLVSPGSDAIWRKHGFIPARSLDGTTAASTEHRTPKPSRPGGGP